MFLGSFSPENLKHLHESETSFEQLKKLGVFWISPDINVEKPVVIPPQQFTRNINIVLNKSCLPNIKITRGAIANLKWSTRSFLAQNGIDIIFHESSLTDEMLKEIDDGKDVLIPLDIFNHGQRAVELGGAVMRLFWVNDNKRLRGENLKEAINSGDFSVEGKEGEDWSYGYPDPKENLSAIPDYNDALCIVLKLKPEKYYTPYDPEPVKIQNSRRDLHKYLVPVPKDKHLDFEIGETPKLKLSNNILAVINQGSNHEGQKHISSPLIDPGSDWPIRTETTKGMSHVDFFLYRKE
jgi:hypothetical protein